MPRLAEILLCPVDDRILQALAEVDKVCAIPGHMNYFLARGGSCGMTLQLYLTSTPRLHKQLVKEGSIEHLSY